MARENTVREEQANKDRENDNPVPPELLERWKDPDTKDSFDLDTFASHLWSSPSSVYPFGTLGKRPASG